ncbi:MAG: T9SS type A sorting domain-containing protein, partial [Bacteroidetes bacterium]|nr:T9SS type A sorting domain-containing protein [Bacteroidota bacterium]
TKEITAIQIDPDNWVLNQVGSITVGIETETELQNFTLIPNPASEKLNLFIPCTEKVDRVITIFDLTGRRMIDIKSDLNAIEMDISELTAGSYLIQVSDGRNIIIKKFIKQN